MSAKNADDLVAKADKKLASFGFFGNKYEDAAELLEKAAVQYKLAKACEFLIGGEAEEAEEEGRPMGSRGAVNARFPGRGHARARLRRAWPAAQD